MTVLLANNVTSSLASPITAAATSMTVTDGSRFPVLSAGQYFYATIIATNGIVEIVKVNTRNGNAMSITRAQDGTNAQAFASGARVEMRINAASVRDTVTDQTGPLDTRLTTAEGDITALEGRMTTAEGDITTIEGDIVALEAFDTTLGTSAGSNSVGFLQAGTGATARTVQGKLRDVVSVKDFGAVGNGIADDTAAIVAARNYVASQTIPPTLVFPAGVYLYSASPNWAFFNATIIADGEVQLRYTGTEYALIFDAGLVQTIFNVNFLGPFVVQATTAAKGGYYVRSVHHSKFEGRVDGCGAAYFGLTVLFSVCSEFNVTTSNNSAGGWYSGARPSGGIYLSRRNAGELVTACTFNNPIVEGVSADGIVLDYASNNIFIGGTSEGNAGSGVSLTTNAIGNTFIGIDFEVNGGSDIYDEGQFNSFIKVNATGLITLLGDNAKIETSTVNSIIDNGNNSVLSNTVYSTLGGALTGTPVNRTVVNLFNASGFYEQNKSYDSVIATVVSVAHNTATTVLALTNVGSNRVYSVVAYSPAVGANYVAYAVVYRDGTNAYVITQTNGANLSITLSGLNVRVTQTSGITLSVTAKAAAI